MEFIDFSKLSEKDLEEYIAQLQYREKVLKARESVNHFNELVLRDRYNNRIKQGGIHKFWNWFIDTCIENNQKKIGIAAPMEHGKTNQISIGRILYWIGKDPNSRIMLVSCSDGKAQEKTNAVKQILEFSPDYKEVFPNIEKHSSDNWTSHRLVVKRDVIGMVDATLSSYSLDTKGIGSRCDVLVFDDAIDQTNSATDALRTKYIERANISWLSRIDDSVHDKNKGICLYVGTAWHEGDLMNFWMQPGSGFTFLKMGVSEDFNWITYEIFNGDHIFKKTEGKVPLWKEKPKQILLNKCIDDSEGLGKRFFDRAYRNKFVSSEEQIFESILNYRDEKIHMDDVLAQDDWYTYMGVDLAISKRLGSAYTVFCVGKMDHQGKKYLIDVVRGKYSSPATAAIALGLASIYNIELGLIENNAYQESILQWIDFFKQDLEIRYSRKMTVEDWEKEKEKLEAKLEKKYERMLRKDISIKFWNYLKPGLLECGKQVINFRSFTSGKNLIDEKVGLPNFASEIESGQWVIPFQDHLKDSRHMYCDCDICAATKELVGYPGAKYKDAVMAWFFLSRAMKASAPRVRST